MQFDPKSAAAVYAGKGTDELIQIAFLEQDYVQQAKELAAAELASRGLKATAQDIERVRLGMEERNREALEYSIRDYESDEAMPVWRQRVRVRLMPYRRVLAMLMVMLMVLACFNGIFKWGFMNLSGRKSEGIALLVGSIFMVFLGPSREDILGQGKGKKKQV